MHAAIYDARWRATSPGSAVVGPGMVSATSGNGLPVPTTVMPSGSRMTSVLPGTLAATVSRNWLTLSADECVGPGRRLIEATVTLRGPGSGTRSSAMSSHQTVAWGAFER